MDSILDLALNGDQRSIGRLISFVENNSAAAKDIMKRIYPKSGRAQIIGITGSPGSGKSTMTDSLLKHFKMQNKKVGVIAVDPSSPFTGGAILGDRLRMQDHALNSAIFIRSMGSRGSLGGVSRGTNDAAHILDACGYDVVIIETVGVGQSEVDIVKIADTVCLVLVPGMGDDVQIMKAGIMEIADLFVVNKADLNGANKVAADVRIMLNMIEKKEWIPPVLLVSSLNDTGVEDLKNTIYKHWQYIHNSNEGKNRRFIQQKMEVKAILKEDISQLVEASFYKYEKTRLLDDILSRKTDPYTVAEKIIKEIVK